jgi:hypothetical protein
MRYPLPRQPHLHAQDGTSATRPSAHTRESAGQTALAGLPAALDQVSQCWRALREEDVEAEAHPSSGPDPLVLEAADPVITHGVALGSLMCHLG